jgi:hypothetical protein
LGKWSVETVLFISISNGKLYFFAHYIGTPYNLFVDKFFLTFRPYCILIGFPFYNLSMSVWCKEPGSIYVFWVLLLKI